MKRELAKSMLEYGRTCPKTPYRMFSGGVKAGSNSGGAGVVAGVAPSGKTITLTFKKEMVTETRCAETKKTNHISRIGPNGDLFYEEICLRDENISHDKSSGPQKVNARFAEGIKPGMFVSVRGEFATVAWPNPNARVPTVVFGVSLK